MYAATRNRVTLRVEEPEQKPGAVIIPDVAQPLPGRGRVLSVGECFAPNGVAVDPGISVGDVVFYHERASVDLEPEAGVVSVEFTRILCIDG